MSTNQDEPLDAALEEWLDRVLAGEDLDPAAFARARELPESSFLPRAEQARWLVGRHAAARGQAAGVPAPPFQLGDFDVQQEAGRGGMGIVFRAEQRSLGRIVAVKVLQPAMVGSERGRERLLREARACARLRHPNVVQVMMVGEQAGICYYAMEWIDGESLASIVRKRRQAGLHCSRAYAAESAALIAKVAHALQHAHDHGLLHRDVKSANILVDAQGEPHLADFGLVKDETEATLTGTGEVLGSQPYMSPEQCAGRRLDARSDVYSLGITLYECLALRLPYFANHAETLRRRILEGRLPPPRAFDAGIPAPLQWICMQACAREPAERYASAALLAADLEAFAHGDEVRARPPSAWLRLRRFAWRARRLLAAAGMLLALAASAWFVLDLRTQAARGELRALQNQVLDLRLADPARLRQTVAAGRSRFPEDAMLQLAGVCADLHEGGTEAARAAIDAAEAALTRPEHRTVVGAARVVAAWLDGGALDAGQEAALRDLAALRSTDAEAMLAAGDLLMLANRYPEAIEILRRVPKGDLRRSTLALAELARAYRRMGRGTEARAAVSAIALLGDSPRSLYDLVHASFWAGQREQARADLVLLRERHPDSAWTVAGELLVEAAGGSDAAQLDRMLARARAARDWPQAALAIGPALFAVHRDAGRIEQALALMTDLVHERPDDPNLGGLLGRTLVEHGRVDEGLEVLLHAAQAGDRRPTERDVHWATWHWFRGDLDQALRHYRASLRLSPTDPQRLYPLGNALMEAAARTDDDAARLALLRECVQVRESGAKAAPRSSEAQKLLADVLGVLARVLGPGSAEAAELERRAAEIEQRLQGR